jgi:hypothetical protein
MVVVAVGVVPNSLRREYGWRRILIKRLSIKSYNRVLNWYIGNDD